MEDPRLQHSDTERRPRHLIRTLRNRQGYGDYIDSQYHMFPLLLFLLKLNVILDGV